MASDTARKQCPELIIVRPDMEKYREASNQIHQVFGEYTALIEPLSLDEAYDLEAEFSKKVFQSEDAKEGPKAFTEKRPPVWKGK